MSDLFDACVRANEIALRLGADEVEAYGRKTRQVEAFLERNDVRLGKSHINSVVGIRVMKAKGVGFSSVNSLDEASIDDATAAALKIARNVPGDANNALPDPGDPTYLENLYDPQADGFTGSDAMARALEMLEAARGREPRVTVDSGSFNAAVYEQTIKNSRGLERSEVISVFSWALMGMARDGQVISNFDYQTGGTHSVKSIDVERTARKFSENVLGSLHARKTESFVGDMVLTPRAVMELVLQTIVSSLSSNNVQKGMSRFHGSRGEEVGSPLLSIVDDGTHEHGLASSSFDREGVGRSPLPLIEKGILRSFMYSTYTANKEGRKSTGHAMGSPRSSPTVGPSNIIIGPGNASKDQLIKGVQRGVLVTRFSGNVGSVSGDFSGVVKGGFLIERGEIVHPVRETLVAGNVFELLKRVDCISGEREWVEFALLPYLRVPDTAVTGA